MSALNLIIARGFGDQVRDIATSGSRAVEWQNQRKAEEQAASINEFELKAAQQDQAGQLQDRARLQGAQTEIDGILSEIAALDQQAQAAGQNIPPEMAAQSAELMRRLQIAAMKGQNPAQLSQSMNRGSTSQTKPVIVQGPNGPVYMDASEAAGMPAYVNQPQGRAPRFAPAQIQNPDGTVSTVMVDTSDPTNRVPIGQAPAKQTQVKPTDTQRAASAYATRMEEAEKGMSEYVPSQVEFYAWKQKQAGNTVSNRFLSEDAQKYFNRAQEWMRAKLRKESGAVIGADEAFQEYTTYFPEPGDSPEVIRQKKEARRIAQRELAGQGVAPGGLPTNGGPQPGTVVDGFRFLGGDPNSEASWEPAQ